MWSVDGGLEEDAGDGKRLGLLAWEMVWPGQGCSGHAEEWMYLREGGGLTDRPSDGTVVGGMRERIQW